jgi:NADH-quinone oxidoreductase subunit L
VIHALHHEQDIWKMGGLKARMPRTYWTFLIGTLALAGVPPLSGFFSKDEILAAAAHRSVPLFLLATLVAMLTAFYMFRLFFVAFRGGARHEVAAHAHESPKVMTWPLVLLAVPAVVAGVWGIDAFLAGQFAPGEAPHAAAWWERLFAPFGHAPLAALAGLAAAAFGLSFAYALYRDAATDPLTVRLGALARAMRHRFYFDELYAWLIDRTHEALARIAAWTDRCLIEGFGVRGLAGFTDVLGRALRLLQSGNLQTYTFLFAVGVAVVLIIFLRH